MRLKEEDGCSSQAADPVGVYRDSGEISLARVMSDGSEQQNLVM